MSVAGGGTGGVSGFDEGYLQPSIMISGASGGFVVSYPVNLTPGQSIPITVGAPGRAGGYPNGGAGGSSSFGSYVVCSGAMQSNPAAEAYAVPGSCGVPGSTGTLGQYAVIYGGTLNGGQTPLGYGSGGLVSRCNGCTGPNPTRGSDASPGVVIVDVLY